MGNILYTLLFLSFTINGFAQFYESDSFNRATSKHTKFWTNSNLKDTVLCSDCLNFATLVVDYDTYEFEGGNLSYYQQCVNCTVDSIPFEILVNEPGDFGDISFRIQNTLDTTFFATIIWMGAGQIYYPGNFSLSYPFNTINNKVEKPGNIEYYDLFGTKVYDDPVFIQAADLAWNKIDSLEITKLFSENNFKVGIYLYPPSVGAFDPTTAKWIIFFYLDDYISSVKPAQLSQKMDQLFIYPNPCNDYIAIKNLSLACDLYQIEILDLAGKQLLNQQIYLESINRIDVSSFDPGVYILKIYNPKGSYHSKFIKN